MNQRTTEAQCLETIGYFANELVQKRGVKLDAVVWDDGWDNFHSLWDFHSNFPNGFRDLDQVAKPFGIAQGVWMSPNGGYATAKETRIAYGQPLGYETNHNGYAMGGPKYKEAFRDSCLRMISDNGVTFFKFDGMGEGGTGTQEMDGASGILSNDIQAILELSRELHETEPDVYVSATAGTWASPFWLLYVDNIWRQGSDSGHHGAGDSRQQWITYRDMYCYRRVKQAGPLYPHNAVMLHGILLGDREGRAPAGMAFSEKSVADEIWSFFASGTGLQELYVSPNVPTDTMLDHIGDAAKWARANEHVLVDAHWVGGDPGKGEVYGRASWQSGIGVISLRNPSDKTQTYTFTPQKIFELTKSENCAMTICAAYPQGRQIQNGAVNCDACISIELQALETVVMNVSQDPITNG
jgi:hypothetical protein